MKQKRERDDYPIRPLNFRNKDEITDFVFGFGYCNVPSTTTPPDATGTPPAKPPTGSDTTPVNTFDPFGNLPQQPSGPQITTDPNKPGSLEPVCCSVQSQLPELYDSGNCSGGMANPHEPEEPGGGTYELPPVYIYPSGGWE